MECWLGHAGPNIAEISAGAGFDWLLIDAEHAPSDLRSTIGQMQVIAGFDRHAVVRLRASSSQSSKLSSRQAINGPHRPVEKYSC